MRIDDGSGRTLVAEVDLNLAQVLSLLQQMGRIGVTQRMDMGAFFDIALFQGQSKGPLQRGATHGFGGSGRPLATMPFGRKEPDWIAMSFPKGAQMLQRARGQGHITVAIAFAGTDMQKHPAGIHVAHLQVQPLTQTQTAGVESDQGDSMVQGADTAQDLAHLLGREDDRQLESGLGPHQFQFRWPGPPEGFLPKEFDGAQGLGGGLAGDFLDALEMNEILTQLLGRNQIWSGIEILGPLANTGEVSLLGARRDWQEFEILSKGF